MHYNDGCTQHVAHPTYVADAVQHRRQLRKDPKSLGQNLYDTVTIIFAYSKHIPNPLSIFSSIVSASNQEREFSDSCPPPLSIPVLDSELQDHVMQGSNSTCNGTIQRDPKVVNVPNGHGNVTRSNEIASFPLQGTLDGARDTTVFAEKRNYRADHPSTNMPKKTERSASLSGPFFEGKNSIFPDTKIEEQTSTMPLTSHLSCDIMDQLKHESHLHHDHRRDQSGRPSFVIDFDAHKGIQSTKPFLNRSLYYTLGDPETLLQSFRDHFGDDYRYSPLPHLDAHCLSHAFRDWNQINGALIFDSLYEALDALFRPPPELDTQKSPRLRPSRKNAVPLQVTVSNDAPERYLSSLEAAHIVMICIHALTSSVAVGRSHTWFQVRQLRGCGVVIPGAPPKQTQSDDIVHPWLEIVDQLEYEPAIRLATRLLQAIGTRRCYEHILATVRVRDESKRTEDSAAGMERLLPVLLGHLTQVEKAALHRKGNMSSTQSIDEDPGWTVTATFMEWLRTVVVKQWDGTVDINKWGSVGTAVTIMAHFRRFILSTIVFSMLTRLQMPTCPL